MSLASRQIKKELNRITEEKLKSGFIPTVDYVLSELNKFYAVVTTGSPTFRARKQAYRKRWDVDNYNENLKEIYNDLNNLYEEIVQQFTTVLINFDFNDSERRRLIHEMAQVDGEIDDLLLLSEGTEGYLYSVHDTFIDRSKIDLRYTTAEINTDAEAIMLRESRKGISKVNLSHYYDVEQYPLLAEEEYADKIVSNKLFPGSKFGYAFYDINTAWSQKIITNAPGKLQVSFIIEINPNIDDETRISRIEAFGHLPRPAKVEPLYSVDNINFKALPLGTGQREKFVSDRGVTVWNFPETPMQYIKFLITMDEEDEAVGGAETPQYLYNIGFKNIALFEMAYSPVSYLYSKAFEVTDPTGELLTIDKVTLLTTQDTPALTEIEHYVSLGDGTDNPENYNWAAVSPINQPNPREPQLIDFRHIAFLNSLPLLQWDEASYDTPIESNNGIDFYEIYQFPYEPVRDTITLYRGLNNWQVTPNFSIERKAIYDESHTFESGNSGGEYITLTFPDFSPIEGDGLIRGSVKVKSTGGSNPDVIYTTPNDYTVDYVNKRIYRTKDSTIRSDGATIYVDYQYDNEVAEPTVYTTYLYILNPDGIDVNIVPFNSAQIEAGQFLKINMVEGDVDLSAETSYHIPPGWHKISTTAEPQSASDRFYSANGSKYLKDLVYKMYAYGEKLQEVSWFSLKNNIKKLDHTKYAVVDYDGDGNKEIVVNYRPQTAKWSTSQDDMLNPDSEPETYELTYKYIATQTNTIYYKAKLSRLEQGTADLTPTLYDYTLRIGY